MKTCKKCGTVNPDQANFCAVCGAPLGKQKKGKGHGGRIALIVLLAVLVLGAGASAGWRFFRQDASMPVKSADKGERTAQNTAVARQTQEDLPLFADYFAYAGMDVRDLDVEYEDTCETEYEDRNAEYHVVTIHKGDKLGTQNDVEYRYVYYVNAEFFLAWAKGGGVYGEMTGSEVDYQLYPKGIVIAEKPTADKTAQIVNKLNDAFGKYEESSTWNAENNGTIFEYYLQYYVYSFTSYFWTWEGGNKYDIDLTAYDVVSPVDEDASEAKWKPSYEEYYIRIEPCKGEDHSLVTGPLERLDQAFADGDFEQYAAEMYYLESLYRMDEDDRNEELAAMEEEFREGSSQGTVSIQINALVRFPHSYEYALNGDLVQVYGWRTMLNESYETFKLVDDDSELYICDTTMTGPDADGGEVQTRAGWVIAKVDGVWSIVDYIYLGDFNGPLGMAAVQKVIPDSALPTVEQAPAAEAPEDATYRQFLQDGGYYWEVTCLETPEYALYDVDRDGVKELIVRGKLLNGYYNQDYNNPDYRDMYYSFTYADGTVTYQGRQEYLPLGCENAQLAEMEFASFELVYNYSFSQEELNEIARSLGAPDSVQVQDYKVSDGPPSYWEGTNSWTVDIELWGDDGGYANSGLVLGSTMTVHMWVPWVYN